jgi:LCP family protein required for cell wall assembly
MKTTLKRGIGRVAVVNGDGRAVLPPGVLSPVQRYRQPERVRSRWRVAGRILFVLVALCLAMVLGIAGGTYLWAAESVAALSPEGQVKLASEQLDLPPPDKLAPVNALVIGYDHRPEDGTAPSRSDTVMLLRADPQGKTISMLSFPRDLIVEVRCPDGGASLGRINSAYAFCGPQGTLETVRNLTNVPIHYLIAVNFDGFRQTVDRLGGVWLDVDRRYYNPNGGVYSTINLWPGYQRLKGSKALDFVRYRHTDSDLYRLARQQAFVKALKQAVNSTWKPTAITKIVAAMRNNVQIGQAGGKGTDLKTLKSYGLFAYGLPSGNFFQVKIGGLMGMNELTTDPSNIQSAIEEFQRPDTQASEKASAQMGLRRRLRAKAGPSPKNTTVVVLNGNGVAGSAANTSYLLSQKGYAVKSPPEGFQANGPGRWAHAFRTQVFFSKAPRARLAAVKMVGLFNSADAKPLPAANTGLPTLSNGAMLTVVVGQTFTGRLTPTAPDRTPPRQPPYVRAGKGETLPSVRSAAAWKVGFPLQIPTVIERSSVIDSEVPYRVYRIGKSRAIRFTFRTGSNEYWGIEETNWTKAPILDGSNFSQAIKGRQYDLYYNGPHLHMVVLRAGGASYWVVNTLLDLLSNETMLEIAKGLRPLHK